MRIFVISLLLITGLLIFPQQSYAIFAGLFTDNRNERAACSEITYYNEEQEFNKYAYSQLEADRVDENCSVYGWGPSDAHINFTSQEFLPKTEVSCGSTIEAIFTKSGSTITNNSNIKINNITTSEGASTINNLSQFTSRRQELQDSRGDTSLLPRELGSIFTHSQLLDNHPLTRTLNSGLTMRSAQSTSTLKRQFEFCEQMTECHANQYADENEIARGDPTTRCANYQKYLVYPIKDANTDNPPEPYIQREKATCDTALSTLAPYKNCLSNYFVPCSGSQLASNDSSIRALGTDSSTKLANVANEGGAITDPICQLSCNPNYNETFAQEFQSLNPYSKATEQLVICTVKAEGTETRPKAIKFPEEGIFVSQNDFDCQEIITPPGAVAYCQGIEDFILSQTSATRHDEIIAQFREPEEHQMCSDPENPQGPLIYWKDSWLDSFRCTILPGSASCLEAVRLKRYACRINGAAMEAAAGGASPGSICPVEVDTETYGDPNAAVSSRRTSIKTQVSINDPNNAIDTYQALYTFTIEPRLFWACGNALAHINDAGSCSKSFAPDATNTNQTEVRKASLGSPIPVTLSGTTDELTVCDAPYVDPDTGETKQKCRTNIQNLSPTDDDIAITRVGNFPRYCALRTIKGHYTSGTSPENTSGIECDWYAYTEGKVTSSCTDGPWTPPTTEGYSGTCSKMSYDLPFRDTSIRPKSLEELKATYDTYFPGNQLEEKYQEIVDQSIAYGYNPAFILALWLEESGGSDRLSFGENIFDFGCGRTPDFDTQLACILNLFDNYSAGGDYDGMVRECRRSGDTPTYEEFMLFFAEGICPTVQAQDFQFCRHNHAQFPERFRTFYNNVAN